MYCIDPGISDVSPIRYESPTRRRDGKVLEYSHQFLWGKFGDQIRGTNPVARVLKRSRPFENLYSAILIFQQPVTAWLDLNEMDHEPVPVGSSFLSCPSCGQTQPITVATHISPSYVSRESLDVF